MGRERLGRIVAYALSRREAYLIVLLVFLAVIVAIVGRWPGWVILASLAAGVVLLGLLVADSLTDPEAEHGASLADVDPGRLHDPALRAKLSRALEYVRAAQQLAGRNTGGPLDLAESELPQLEQAARSIYQMSLRLQEFRADRLLPRDLADLQQQKTKRGQLTQEQEEQLGALRQLDNLVRTAEQEIDGALAHLGRSYAEMQAIKVTPELRGRPAEALDELGASTKRLSELAEGYDEAYGARAGRGSQSQGVKP